MSKVLFRPREQLILIFLSYTMWDCVSKIISIVLYLVDKSANNPTIASRIMDRMEATFYWSDLSVVYSWNSHARRQIVKETPQIQRFWAIHTLEELIFILSSKKSFSFRLGLNRLDSSNIWFWQVTNRCRCLSLSESRLSLNQIQKIKKKSCSIELGYPYEKIRFIFSSFI